MGYFSNGTEGDCYYEQWCSHCIHEGPEEGQGCAVWGAHLFKNYEECNKKNSILHDLIPRKGGENLQCAMFISTRKGQGDNFVVDDWLQHLDKLNESDT